MLLGGCYEAIYKAVVDDPDHKPGGTVVTMLSGAMIGSTPALAELNPTVISGGNVNFFISITAGDDIEGSDAHTKLAVAGASISLPIGATTRSGVSLSYGGTQCRATEGVIDLAVDSGTALTLTGSFDATGVMGTGNTPCTLNGTITSVPQVR